MYETWDDMKNWKIVLTGIVFGVNLLWPVPIEGDSVLCRSTGTTVKQWFISSISIQGFCTEVMGEKNKRSHRVRLLISIRSRRDGCLSYKRVMVKKAVSQKEEHGDKVCSTVLLIRHLCGIHRHAIPGRRAHNHSHQCMTKWNVKIANEKIE